jgi:hypothetical protein
MAEIVPVNYLVARKQQAIPPNFAFTSDKIAALDGFRQYDVSSLCVAALTRISESEAQVPNALGGPSILGQLLGRFLAPSRRYRRKPRSAYISQAHNSSLSPKGLEGSARTFGRWIGEVPVVIGQRVRADHRGRELWESSVVQSHRHGDNGM